MPACRCPGCKRAISYDDHESGTRVECAGCSVKFYLPGGRLSPPPPRAAPDAGAVAETAPASPDYEDVPPEPWYYRGLVAAAWAWYALTALGWFAYLAGELGREPPSGAAHAGGMAAALLLLTGAVLLAGLAAVMAVLVFVDHARNARAVRYRDR